MLSGAPDRFEVRDKYFTSTRACNTCYPIDEARKEARAAYKKFVDSPDQYRYFRGRTPSSISLVHFFTDEKSYEIQRLTTYFIRDLLDQDELTEVLTPNEVRSETQRGARSIIEAAGKTDDLQQFVDSLSLAQGIEREAVSKRLLKTLSPQKLQRLIDLQEAGHELGVTFQRRNGTLFIDTLAKNVPSTTIAIAPDTTGDSIINRLGVLPMGPKRYNALVSSGHTFDTESQSALGAEPYSPVFGIKYLSAPFIGSNSRASVPRFKIEHIPRRYYDTATDTMQNMLPAVVATYSHLPKLGLRTTSIV